MAYYSGFIVTEALRVAATEGLLLENRTGDRSII